MHTEVCDRLGTEFPIFAFSHCRDVVAAVSRVGGLGVLGAVAYSPEDLDVALTWLDEHVGDRPYGVDVIVPARYVGDGSGGLRSSQVDALIPAGHRAFVEDVLERYGVAPLPDQGAGQGTDRPMPFSRQSAHDLLRVVWGHPKVKLIANALGPAPDYLVEAAHARGLMVAGLVGTVEHARRQKEAGVDVVVAQGSEAGGHTGEIGTMVLVPQIVDAVAPLPVLAAGGIADGRQVAAAMALGAAGVWCGSVWLTTDEAETHPVVKEKFLAASSADTVRSRAKTGKPARQLRSAWTDEWDRPDTPEPLGMPLQSALVARAEARIARSAASSAGARDLINYFVGQAVGQMTTARAGRPGRHGHGRGLHRGGVAAGRERGAVNHLVSHYGYWAVFLVLGLEAFGIPIPGETILIVAGTYAGTHHNLSVWLIWLVAFLGVELGATLSYWVGVRGGYPLLKRYGHYIRMNEPQVKVGRYVFDRYGAPVVSFGRFVTVLRTYVAFLAGTNRMNPFRFQVFNILGAVVWTGTWTLLSYYVGDSLKRASRPADYAVGAVAVIAVVAAILFVRHHAKRLEAVAEAAFPGSLTD